MSKQLDNEQLELLQGLQNDFNKAKIEIADMEIKKSNIITEISKIQEKFAEQEQILMKEFGQNAIINLQTGEVKDPEPETEQEKE
jgi:predicted  nucleic acid-binding Zn-ribbon protein|tara:strand:- start:8678 stop:8932 length:255 start_codon:yes stop_codon:yes gene_type:complete